MKVALITLATSLLEKPATFTRQRRFRVVIAFVLLCSRHPSGLPIGIIVG
jgi:hypothetical protein